MVDTLFEIVVQILVLAILLLAGQVAARLSRQRLSIMAKIGASTIGASAVPVVLPKYRHVVDVRAMDMDVFVWLALTIWFIATWLVVRFLFRRSDCAY